MKTNFLNLIYQLVAMIAANFSHTNMKQQQLAGIDNNSSIEAPVGVSDKGVNYFKNLSKLFRKTKLKYAMLVAMAIGGASCTPEDPMEDLNQNPNPTTATINADDATNRLTVDVNGNDPDGDAVTYYAEAGSTTDASLARSLPLDGQGKFNDILTGQGTYNYVDHWSVDSHGASSTKVRKTINLTVEAPNNVPGGTLTLDPTVGEHAPIGTDVGDFEATDADAGDNLTATVTQGGEDYELVLKSGETRKYDVLTKKVQDFDAPNDANNNHNLKIDVSDGTATTEVTGSIAEADENDVVSTNSVNSPNSMVSSVTINVANDNSGVENLVDYEADKDGNSTGRTMAQMAIDINANVYDNSWNLTPALGNLEQYIKDNSGNPVLTSTSGTTDDQLIRAAFTDVDNFAQTADQMSASFYLKALQEGRKILEAAGHTTTNPDAWAVSYISGADEDITFSLFNLTLGNQYARERAAGNMESVNPDIVRKSANIVESLTPDQRRERYKNLITNGN